MFNLFLAKESSLFLFIYLFFFFFGSIKVFLISYLPHNLFVQCFTHARLGLRECQVVRCIAFCVVGNSITTLSLLASR